MEGRKRKRLKITIMILAVLLAVSIISLAGLWFWHWTNYNVKAQTSPNIITPETGESVSETVRETAGKTELNQKQGRPSGADGRKAPEITLCKNHAGVNIPFSAEGMLPGDSVRKEYCVEVFHDGAVEVSFDIRVLSGAKLGEVLQCSVKRMPEGSVVYEGLLRDMPEKIEAVPAGEKNSRLAYEITVSLDPSVGNEYQNQNLKADFVWSVPDPDHLTSPDTGGSFIPAVWIAVFAVSLIAIVFLLIFIRKTKKENHHEK